MSMPGEAEVKRLGSEAKAVLKTAPLSRIYFLDNLKVLIAILVVLDHAAQPYGPGGAWVIPSEPGSPLDYLVIFMFLIMVSAFFMGLFFMISAYFVPSSLERKGAAKFMEDRLSGRVDTDIHVRGFPGYGLSTGRPAYHLLMVPVVPGVATDIFGSLCSLSCWLKNPIQSQRKLFPVMRLSWRLLLPWRSSLSSWVSGGP